MSLDNQPSGFSSTRTNDAAGPIRRSGFSPVNQYMPDAVLVPVTVCDEVQHHRFPLESYVDDGGSIAQSLLVGVSSLGVSWDGSSSSKVDRVAIVKGPRSVFEFGEPSLTSVSPDSRIKLGSTLDLGSSLVVLPRQCCECSDQVCGYVEVLGRLVWIP